MSNSPTKENDCRQDTLERLNNWLDVLERRIHALLDTNDLESMNPAEREQAAIRHLMFLLKGFELRQKYAVSSDMDEYQAVLDALRYGTKDYEPVENAGYDGDYR